MGKASWFLSRKWHFIFLAVLLIQIMRFFLYAEHNSRINRGIPVYNFVYVNDITNYLFSGHPINGATLPRKETTFHIICEYPIFLLLRDYSNWNPIFLRVGRQDHEIRLAHWTCIRYFCLILIVQATRPSHHYNLI